jgi:hypothetical protein
MSKQTFTGNFMKDKMIV